MTLLCWSFFPPGVYLPLLWEQSFCWKSPIALGYTRGHFSALVAMENDGYGNRGAGANLNTDDDVTVTFLPLVDSERKLLHVHFLSAQEVRGASLPLAPPVVSVPQPGPGHLSGGVFPVLPAEAWDLAVVSVPLCKYRSARLRSLPFFSCGVGCVTWRFQR